MLDAEIKSVCKNCYNAPNAFLPCRLPLNYSESIGGGGAGGQGRTMLRKKCCDFDWLVFAKMVFCQLSLFLLLIVREMRRRNGWLTLSLSGRGCGGGSSWFGGRSVVSRRVDVSDDFVVGNIGLVEFQLRLWIAVIHAKGTFGHYGIWNLNGRYFEI